MKKIFIIALLLISAQVQSFAQKNKEIVYITDMKEDPYNLSILNLELPIWHLFGSMYNTSLYDVKSSLSYVGKGKINGGATFNWQLGDRIMPDSDDRTEYVYTPMVMSQFKTAPAQSFEAWGTYFFREEDYPQEVSIRIKKVGNTIYYTNVEAHEVRKIGLRLGYKQGYTWYNMNNMDMIVAPAATPSLTETVNFNSMSTFQNYKMIKAGISITKSTNVKVQLEEYGERKSSGITMDNFNLIFAVQNDFEDVIVGRPNTDNNTIEFVEYLFSDENKRLPIGFEYTHKSYSKDWFSYEYGIGYYPGLMKKINIGVHFGASVSIDFLRKNNNF